MFRPGITGAEMRTQKSFVCVFRSTTFTGNTLAERLLERFKIQILVSSIFKTLQILIRFLFIKSYEVDYTSSDDIYRCLENKVQISKNRAAFR